MGGEAIGSGVAGSGSGFGLGRIVSAGDGGGAAGYPSSASFASQGALPLPQAQGGQVNGTVQHLPTEPEQYVSLFGDGQASGYGPSAHYGDTVLE